jgi:hypothetical protein
MLKFFRRLSEFVQDDTGLLSSTRLAFLLTIFSVLGVWIYACIVAKKFLPMEGSVVYLTGVLMVGKVTQSFAENQSSQPATPPENVVKLPPAA